MKIKFLCFLCATVFLRNKDAEVFRFACLWIKQNKWDYYVDWVMYLIHNRE